MKRANIHKEGQRPLKLFIELLLAILIVEMLVMLLLHLFIEPLHLSAIAEGLLDSFSLVIFLFPILYFLFYRPLSLEIARYKQSMERVQELKTGYNVIIRAAMDGFWIIDTQGRLLDVNDAYCRLTGYSRQELLAMSIADVEALEKPEDTQRHIQQIMKTGSDRFETRHRAKDGRIVDMEVSVNYLDTDNGRIFAFLRDITERKKNLEQLLESNAINQSLIQTIPFGMDIVNEEGNILYLSPRLEAALDEEAIGKKCWQLYRDDKQQCRDCPLRKEIVPGETASIETDGVFGGRSFQINHSGMIYQGKKAVLEIFQDISERKKTEVSLEKLAVAVRQTADIIVITDRNGNIEYVNPAFETQTGYKIEEVLGKTPRILKSGIQDKSFYERLWKTILSGEVFRGVLINKKKDGRLYYSEKTITPIKDKDGNIYSFISTDKDITERKKAEEELLRLNKELLELDRMKSEFINMASHELRTPIAIMREGISQVVEGLRGEMPAQQKRFLSISLSNIDRLIKIVDSIFDISEIEYSRGELDRELTDITALARETIANFSQQAKDKGLEIKQGFPGKKIELDIDKARIKQVFANLISNAFDFTDQGSIEISIQEKDAIIECSVSDTGRGIPEALLPGIFGKFQQSGKSYGPGAKGVGLGLAIAKAIVERHKGRIWVESKLGQGATFSFSLPKENTKS